MSPLADSAPTTVPRDGDGILRLRLANELLVDPQLTDPAAVVAHLLAAQAQDYPAAKWSLGQRLREATDTTVERAFSSGAVLRTHVLRPTWHFVTPADIRWMLELTAPRIKRAMAFYHRGIDASAYARTNAMLPELLAGGLALTRAELGAALRQAGIAEAVPAQLGTLLMAAELDAIICSGPRQGKQATYALLDDRAPDARRLERDEALAELTWRYFASHGPATLRDCCWWSGLTIGDVRRGLEQVRHRLEQTTVGGLTYWFAPRDAPPMPEQVYLLPNFDEYTIAFRDREVYFDAARGRSFGDTPAVPFGNTIVVRGRVAGVWRRTINQKGNRLAIQARWFDPPTSHLERRLQTEVQRIAAFYTIPADLSTEY